MTVEIIAERLELREGRASEDEKVVYKLLREDCWMSLRKLRHRLKWKRRRMNYVIYKMWVGADIEAKYVQDISNSGPGKRRVYRLRAQPHEKRFLPLPKRVAKWDLHKEHLSTMYWDVYCMPGCLPEHRTVATDIASSNGTWSVIVSGVLTRAVAKHAIEHMQYIISDIPDSTPEEVFASVHEHLIASRFKMDGVSIAVHVNSTVYVCGRFFAWNCESPHVPLKGNAVVMVRDHDTLRGYSRGWLLFDGALGIDANDTSGRAGFAYNVHHDDVRVASTDTLPVMTSTVPGSVFAYEDIIIATPKTQKKMGVDGCV